METREDYLVFYPKSIFLSRSSRFNVALCSNTSCFLKHFEIFISVDNKIWFALTNLQ